MLFNSYIFIFLFLPLCLIGYFLLNKLKSKKPALVFLLGMSLWFYGYFNPSYLIIIVASVLVNFFFYRLSKGLEGERARKWAKIIAVGLNIGVLFYFKYFDFFIENINAIFRSDIPLRNILLPLGISFFTFQQISFVVDSFNGEVGEYDFLSYACFVTFFPQLIAGPIVTHDELAPQLMDESKKKFNWDNFAPGLYIFAIGLAKKVLLADILGNIANYGFAAVGDYRYDTMTSLACFVTMLSYTLQLYFDFSGYSDMAIGIGKMFNIDLPQNFDSPYKAITIADFWKRWHKTLTRFLTKYVYIPLGGNRKGLIKTCVNILIVYLLSGLWHGAGWTFIVWGALHGILSVIYRLFRKAIDKIPKIINWAVTFLCVNILWVFFRADTFKDAMFIIAKVLRPSAGGICYGMLESIKDNLLYNLIDMLPKVGETADLRLIIMVALLAVSMFIVLVPKNAYEQIQNFKPTVGKSLFIAGLIVLSVFSFAGVSTFLYFNF